MKIIQVNVWTGNMMPSLLKFIELEQPDIICTQEILSTSDTIMMFPNYQIHERLSERFAYQFFAPTLSIVQAGSEMMLGNAIYSLHPIENPQTVFTYGAYLAKQEVTDFKDNIRNIQICSVRIGDSETLTVVNHHGYHELTPNGSEKAVESMKRAAESLARIRGPLVVCGDFNVNPESPSMRELDSLKLHNLTVEYKLDNTLSPASRIITPVVCDYILVNDDIEVKSFRASDQLVSDHKALILEFDIT